MAKSIQFTEEEWTQLKLILVKEYGVKPSIFMIREVMKRELGFTIRTHREWSPRLRSYQEHIMLDFWNEEKETFFRLKYL